MTAIPGTVGITGLLAPKNAEDTHPTHEDTYGKGGFRPVANTTARDTIPEDRLKVGMLVYSIADDRYYRCTDTSAPTWVEAEMSFSAIVEDTTYYVDGSAGDDSNDGLAWGTAKQTFGFLFPGEVDSLPRRIDAAVIIYFRNDILARDSKGNFQLRDFYGSGSITIEGTLTAEETFTVSSYDNDPANRYSRHWVVDGTKTWTPDAWRHYFAEVATGYEPSLFYPVLSNTETKLVIPYGRSITGTPNGTIYSAPQLLAELVTDPGVQYTSFAYSEFFKVENNYIDIQIKNFWIDERITWVETPQFSNSVNVAITHGYFPTGLFVFGVGVYYTDSCFFRLENWGTVGSLGMSNLSHYACAFYSSDGLGYTGPDEGGTATYMKCYFYGLETAIWGSGRSLVDCRFENYFENCINGILITTGNLALPDLGVGGARFDACTTGISGVMDMVYQEQFLYSWDTTTEIMLGETDTATFAELMAKTLQSLVGFVVNYFDSDYNLVPRDEYNNTTSGLTAVNYQNAIDELAANGGGNARSILFEAATIDLINDTNFTLLEDPLAVVKGTGYILTVAPSTGSGFLTVELYQDAARLVVIKTMTVDLTDATTFVDFEAFGFELETAGTIYGTAFVSEVGESETFDLTLNAIAVEVVISSTPVATPYGQGIEDDGTGKPRIALASDGGLGFDGDDSLVIVPDVTAPATILLGVGGASVTGAVTTTTDEDISAKKRFTAVGLEPLADPGPPISGTYLTGQEILDSNGVKWRCTSGGTAGTWILVDMVADAEADYYTAELAPGGIEVVEVLTSGDFGILQRFQIWGVVADAAEYSSDFRARVYMTSDILGTEVLWQGAGIVRQSFLIYQLPAAQAFLDINNEDMFETEEACVVFEDSDRYEMCRITERVTNKLSIDEALVDPSVWDADTLVCSVVQFENVPFRNIDASPSSRQRIFLQIRNDDAANSVTFYVRVLPLSFGAVFGGLS